ncbi:MAG TPA: DUF302 domain-containing protein [Ktedonobacterales bacterium]|nr:DUF302 domain-containing protein [Ktedonobacterales bacterium]
MTDHTRPPASANGVVSTPSPYSVTDTLEHLEQAIAGHGLTLFAHIDHSGEAARAGLAMQPAHVLIFGSPKAGTPLMAAAPLLALDLPLRALVWQDGDGHVWVSYNSTAYLAGRYAIPPERMKNIAGIDQLILGALQG